MQTAASLIVALGILLAVAAPVGSQIRSQKAPPKAKGPRPIHDPSTIVREQNEYWLFATGRGVASWRSKDLVSWKPGPPVFADSPKWVADAVPRNRGDFWAPDIIFHDGRYLLYYSVSSFGKNTSAIALATTPTLDPENPKYLWADRGIVVRTTEKDNFNAIDPSVIRTADGKLWLAFGSFWSGIKLIELHPKTGLRVAAESPIHSLANKEQIEAAALYQHGDYIYLFVNWGWCCRGVRSTYNIRVGRSKTITGPYLDRDGVEILKGGGSLLLETDGRFIGPGHAGILKDGDRFLLSYHFYDKDRNGRSDLAIRVLEWDKDGWPRIAGKPITPAAKE